jgi:hypothetical protein
VWGGGRVAALLMDYGAAVWGRGLGFANCIGSSIGISGKILGRASSCPVSQVSSRLYFE